MVLPVKPKTGLSRAEELAVLQGASLSLSLTLSG
jgi:hypothetical protein